MTKPVASFGRGGRTLRGSLRTRAALGVLGITILLVIVLLGVLQIVLPGIVAGRLRSSLERSGEGVRVAVHAVPAVELLFDHADSVTVHIKRLRPGGHGGLDSLLARASHATRINATVGQLYAGPLELREVSLRKRGRKVKLQATVTRTAIASALPADIQLVGHTEEAAALHLKVTADVFGHRIAAAARVLVEHGALEISPELPILDLLRLTIFADPQVAVEAVRMSAHGEAFMFAAEGNYV